MIFRHWESSMIIQCITVMTAILSIPDELPPPRNLSYVWTDEFHVKITWEEPEDLGSCRGEALQYGVNVTVGVKQTKGVRWRDMFYDHCIITTEEMGHIGAHYTIETLCGNKRRSKPLNQTIYPPAPNIELAKDFECYLYSTHRMNCSWIPDSQVPDLQIFYRVCSRHHDTTFSICEYSDLERKSCDLRVKQIHEHEEICILLNGTLNGASVRNTFKLKPHEKVKPPPPKLTIQEHGKKLIFSWTTPDIVENKENKCWKYIVNYTACNVPLLPLQVHESMVTVTYNEDCRYEVQVKSEFKEFCGKGGSDISNVEIHGVNKDRVSSMIVAVIVIPASLSACVILACYYFRRHRAMICPVVPDPSVIFKEMMGSSYEPKSALGNLYIPAQEDVESCKICLVTEDRLSQPDT